MHASRLRLLAILLLASSMPAAAIVDCAPHPRVTPRLRAVEPLYGALIPYPAIDPHQVIDVFLTAVDRGELTAFSEPLRRPLLDPRQVEYLYTLDSHLPTVRVYSILKESVPIPGERGLRATAVTGVLDRDGRIVDSIIHCE